MKVCSGNVGTAIHIEYLHMQEDDSRRDKRRCIHYRSTNNFCAKDMGKCLGSSHCKKYREKVTRVNSGTPMSYTQCQIVNAIRGEGKAKKKKSKKKAPTPQSPTLRQMQKNLSKKKAKNNRAIQEIYKKAAELKEKMRQKKLKKEGEL